MRKKRPDQDSSNQTTLTIGQLAKRVGLRTSALRYYEEQGLLHHKDRTRSGYRLYDPEAEQILRFIKRAQRLGFSLSDIRTLLEGWQSGNLSDEAIIRTAEARHLALERQVTELLVLQHELELFLQDMRQKASEQADTWAESLFDRLIDRVCASPLIQPTKPTLHLLMDQLGCSLTTDEGQALIDTLKGQHAHIWQESNGYQILVVSQDPEVGAAMGALAKLEVNCQKHTYADQAPELMHDGEGYLLTVRGESAFVFARLFLALQREVAS
jgi:MerR family copper efflux transcriptional regulator